MSAVFETTASLRMSIGDAAPQPQAWFISSADSRVWLDEMCAWGISLDEIRLLVIPQSARDRRPCGVLALAPQRLIHQIKPSPRAEPYKCIDDRVYLPMQAELHPPVGESELSHLFPFDVQMIHPAIGPIGGDLDELLAIADLLEPPAPTPAPWDAAVPGIACDAHLKSIRPAAVMNFEAFMKESGGDIGDIDPTQLPPLPNESPLRNLASRGAVGILGALSWLAEHLGGGSEPTGTAGEAASAGSAGGNWMERFRGWSAARMRAFQQALEAARNREMGRLMSLLESNPDEGLRYAPPMLGEGYRGRAPPGWRLGRRNVSFNLGSLFSSRAADPWNTEAALRQRLIAKYRELATRELRLGRHRRAAYIFAELLRDLHAAANALRQGRFYREAAILYREKMNDRASAAQCLEEGGLLAEAIELYESLRRFEKVGDLYRKLDHEEEAQLAYRQAVSLLLANNDQLSAARLLRAKLDAADEAIDLLDQAWPYSNQAAACLEELFLLFSQTARHEAAIAKLQKLGDPQAESSFTLQLANVLANVAASYSSVNVRNLAADTTRVVVGRRLPFASSADARSLVNAVTRVAPEDRLLPRDTHRYLEQLPKPAPVPVASVDTPSVFKGDSKRTQKAVTMLKAFHLGTRAQWRTMLSTGSTFWAIGVNDNGVVLARGGWDGQLQHAIWKDPLASENEYRMQYLAGLGLVAFAAGSERRLPPQNMNTYLNLRTIDQIGCPAFLPPGRLYDVSIDEQGIVWVLHGLDSDPNLIVSAYASTGELRSSNRTPLDLSPITARLLVRNGHVCVIFGSQAWIWSHEKWTTVEFGRSIATICPSTLHTRFRMGIAFEEGACMFWPAEQRMHNFGQSLLDPALCMLNDGTLVAAGRRTGMIYRIDGDKLLQVSAFSTIDSGPVAIVPTHNSGEFAELLSNGAIRIYRIA